MFIILSFALHIDTITLSDGTYELIPESDGGDIEAQVNTAELTEALDQSFMLGTFPFELWFKSYRWFTE